MRRLVEREERRQKRQQQRPAPARARGTPPGERKGGLLARLGGFLGEVRLELRRVSWPTREQMTAFTAVTLITTLALTLLVFGFDVVMKEAVLLLIDRTVS
ncbi:MAG: preprotein translocase subunit SecE [Acidimicrobiia bacterium]